MYPPPFGPHGVPPQGSIAGLPSDMSNVFNLANVSSTEETRIAIKHLLFPKGVGMLRDNQISVEPPCSGSYTEVPSSFKSSKRALVPRVRALITLKC